MKEQHTDLSGLLLMEARRVRVVECYPPRIASCLRLLSEEEIWLYASRGMYASGLFPG